MKNKIRYEGYTLIEILVALTVFAILSAMTTTAMYHAFTTRERINVRSSQLNALQLGITILSRDTEQIIKFEPFASDNDTQLAFTGQSNSFEFTRGGFVNPNADAPRSTIQRISYLCKNNQLIRRSWGVATPISQDHSQDKILFNNLKTCHFAYINSNHDTLRSWPDSLKKEPEAKNQTLPIAIQVNITIEHLGNMGLLFAVPGGLYA